MYWFQSFPHRWNSRRLPDIPVRPPVTVQEFLRLFGRGGGVDSVLAHAAVVREIGIGAQVGCLVSGIRSIGTHFIGTGEDTIFIFIVVYAFDSPVAQGEYFRAEKIIDELESAVNVFAAGGDAEAV